MTARIGEYAIAGYRKHAPASTAGAPFQNGTTLDAGTLIIVDSNISWLCHENVRQLVFCAGPGVTKVTFGSNQAALDGLPGFGGSGSTAVPHQEIPWDRRTAARFGPFPLVADELVADGTTRPRTVKAAVRVTHGVTTLDLYTALTIHGSAERMYGGEFLAFVKNTAVTTGTTQTFTLTPSVRIPSNAASLWKCRPGGGAAASVILPECWLWVGWRPVGGATASIDAVTAWETR